MKLLWILWTGYTVPVFKKSCSGGPVQRFLWNLWTLYVVPIVIYISDGEIRSCPILTIPKIFQIIHKGGSNHAFCTSSKVFIRPFPLFPFSEKHYATIFCYMRENFFLIIEIEF